MRTTVRIPLLKDHHSHPFLYAALAACPDIASVRVKSEALERIGSCFPGAGIGVVTGWNDSYFTFAEGELDSLPPLVVFNVSLHSLLINSGAQEILYDSFPELIDNYRSAAWLERNAGLVLNFLIGVKPCCPGKLGEFYRQLASQGVWQAEEMSLRDSQEIGVFRQAGLLGRTRFWTGSATFDALDASDREQVHGIKLFGDGALGARTAGLGAEYSCGARGLLVYGDAELARLISRAYQLGKAVALHAIGDSAVDQAVAVLERIADQRPGLPETRIEHCQFISRPTAMKAKSLGIILSMQPNFSLDSICYRDRLPGSYLSCNNPFRMLLDEAGFVAGRDLLFGSDGMPHGARCALESALFPPFPGQRLTLEEFIAGYCMPDCHNGHIDASIDYEGRRVDLDVVLKDGGER